MEDNKVVEFPHTVEQELSPQEQKVVAELNPIMEQQDNVISEMVAATCRSFDAQAAESESMPIFMPMEAGIAIAATYLNMITDEQGTPVEGLLGDIENLSNIISKAVNDFYDNNPEASSSVYYYALMHTATSSLRHQRLLNNVSDIERRQAEQEGAE